MSKLFRRGPVNLFFDRRLVQEAAALQDRFAIGNHVGMAAKVGVSVGRVQSPRVSVFSQDIVSAADLPRPVSMIPRTAYGRNVFQKRQLFGEAGQLIFISELPGAAGAVQQV